jgi:fatty-acyl-CoA synthase
MSIAVTSPADRSQYCRLIQQALSRRDDATAFIHGDRRFTYRDARSLVSRFVKVFEARGLTGSAVGALSKNSPEIYLADLATMLVGSRWTGLHPLGTAENHAGVCDDAGIETLIVEAEYADMADKVRKLSGTVRNVFVLGPSGSGDDLLELASREIPGALGTGPASGQDIARVMYTGGTTGDSKGCALTHGNVATLVMNASAAWQLPQRPVFLASAPITHATFLFLLSTLTAGGTLVMMEGFKPEPWLDAVEKHKVNSAFVVPTMIYGLLDSPALQGADVSSLETVAYGGSTVAPTRLREAIDRMGRIFVQVYGQTECLAQGLSLLREEHDFDLHPGLLESAGRPVPGAEVTLRDDLDQEVEIGTPGEICIRAGTVMAAYWGRPKESAETLAGGWLRTGDIGVKNEDGYYFVVDRKKDMIVSGGFNIFPREVENVIASHDAVSQVSVIGVPHERWGEEVRAIVVLKPGNSATSDELVALVKEHKGSLYAPKTVEFVEELPVTAVGKIDKKKLRAAYWSNSGRQV